MNIKLKTLIALTVSLSVGLSSCTKDTDAINAAADLRDSVYAYSQEVYLWSDNLPATNFFNPLSYPSADSIMRKVRTYSPFVNGRYQDRWSFVIDKARWDNVVSGNSTDTGAEYGFNTDSDLRVKLVYSQSSAGKQGVTRGWKALKINGIDGNYANIKQLNTELGKASQTIVFQKPDHNQVTLTLTGSS